MPELEYESLNDILSHNESYVEIELGECIAAALKEVSEDE